MKVAINAVTFLLICALPADLHGNTCTVKRIKVAAACGQVVDILGEPIDSAEVAILEPSTRMLVAKTHVDASGRFTLMAFPKGDYILRVIAPHWDTVEQPMHFSAPNAKKCERVVVIALATPGTACWSHVTVKRNTFRK